ncbi:MAG: hypothetical protein VX043_02675 [Candidatus Thermoplasmatota archaeon]|nr:hypothetical protein [Candidatus Thermoplasmatota archaeon]MEC8258065.1 hypothetical protein [Candidatus Thermoplasmatota archaeon]MEC8313254.1 hypothetical protein [Candidatus Thermoplasmatota archaeon]MEC8353013.1 hypothetical protein [Candidatus Thermoplasmatota archaeon]
MNPKKALITVVLACFFAISYTPNTAAQDQVEIPSWEVGWETNMDGVYELSLSGQEDIKDTIEFFVTNERMVDLNLEITIEWDESDNIPIELEYDESISIAASENQTFTIEISDLSGYSFERSPTNSMTLLLGAQEVALDQPVSTQEIEAELTVPSVFDLQIESQSKNEVLYAGSSVEYIVNVINQGNTKDVIKNPQSSVKSCPSLSVEGLDIMRDIEVENTTQNEFMIRISASASQPERICEVTISIKSAGNGKISSTIFEIDVNSNSASDDEGPDNSIDQSDNNQQTELTETDTLNFVGTFEIILIVIFAVLLRHQK